MCVRYKSLVSNDGCCLHAEESVRFSRLYEIRMRIVVINAVFTSFKNAPVLRVCKNTTHPIGNVCRQEVGNIRARSNDDCCIGVRKRFTMMYDLRSNIYI